MQTNNQLHGIFPAITFHDNAIHVAYGLGEQVIVDKFNGSSFERVYESACGGKTYARLISINNELHLFYVMPSGQEIIHRNITTGSQRVFTGTFYNWPIAVGKNVFAINNHDTGRCVLYNYDNSEFDNEPVFPVSGIAYIKDNNEVISWDDAHGAERQQWGIFDASYAEEMFCGANQDGGVGIVCENKRIVVNEFTYTNEPKITKCTENSWAIVTGDYNVINLFYDITKEDVTGGVIPIPPIPPSEQVIHVKSGDVIKIIVD